MNSTQPAVIPTHQPGNRQAVLLKSGLAALALIAERWDLHDDSRTRLVSGNKGTASTVSDCLERVSHILGIYRAATALFRHREAVLLQWLRARNNAPPFAGFSPIETILDGRNLSEIRGYLECQLAA